ncbi:hypothetical protein PJ900_09585 [Tistrella mobilis]|uniref:Uncharacterized protein n=1 Tax=Tistrella mobilis TaxID=171437 RepID=A0A162KU91_9PROT|nr:hypothetical protein [Tistrella mobilis]KYO52096.1 hypothetical protein AUP44_06350 [Tistrella mobilis]
MERVDHADGRLRITRNGRVTEVAPSEIVCIDDCELEDPIHQGDERFHIIHGRRRQGQGRFWLIGPFVPGGLAAVAALTAAHPELPRRDVVVRGLPWKLRDPGWLGLRLMPVAGLGEFPERDLPTIMLRDELKDSDDAK